MKDELEGQFQKGALIPLPFEGFNCLNSPFFSSQAHQRRKWVSKNGTRFKIIIKSNRPFLSSVCPAHPEALVTATDLWFFFYFSFRNLKKKKNQK